MRRDNFSDLLAFIAVARERSFTRAAAQLSVSQSALSHAIRRLEVRLGIRLLTRTTRSVAPTQAGERLLNSVAPRFDQIETELQALGESRDKPAGTIRITATDHAANTVLWPKLARLLPENPALKIEISIDYGLSDIVSERYDMGVRLGDQIAKDMVAVRIAPDMRMAIVGAPSYLSKRSLPLVPHDLTSHDCINLRLPTSSGLYAWELKNGDRALQARVEGQLTFNGLYPILDAALAGFGLAYLPSDLVLPHVVAGHLRCVLEDWTPTFPGLHAFYPRSRQSSRAMALVIDALRHRS